MPYPEFSLKNEEKKNKITKLVYFPQFSTGRTSHVKKLLCGFKTVETTLGKFRQTEKNYFEIFHFVRKLNFLASSIFTKIHKYQFTWHFTIWSPFWSPNPEYPCQDIPIIPHTPQMDGNQWNVIMPLLNDPLCQRSSSLLWKWRHRVQEILLGHSGLLGCVLHEAAQ